MKPEAMKRFFRRYLGASPAPRWLDPRRALAQLEEVMQWDEAQRARGPLRRGKDGVGRR